MEKEGLFMAVQSVRIGIVGDYNPDYPVHISTNNALSHAAEALSAKLDYEWLSTESLFEGKESGTFHMLDGVWCAPGSPYKSMDGAMEAIRVSRETDLPFIGTCGGFQHAVLEYARNVLGVHNAEHEETSPYSPFLLINRLKCSLTGKTQAVNIEPDSCAHRIYGSDKTEEHFLCSFGMNPEYQDQFEKGELRITGRDSNGEARIVELPSHRFFLATLFVPQVKSLKNKPHPLIVAYVKAALDYKNSYK
jgi:CTP synthase (UTP-ammonia lyase)